MPDLTEALNEAIGQHTQTEELSTEEVSEATEEQATADPLAELKQKYQNEYQVQDFDQHTEALYKADQYAKQNPEQFMRDFARNHGIDYQQSEQQPVEDDLWADPVDPKIKQLEEQNNAIAAQLNAMINHQAQVQIDEFKKQANQNGELKHPHFDRVKNEIGAVMQYAQSMGKNMSLGEAYETALWTNPQTRAEMIKRQASAQTQGTSVGTSGSGSDDIGVAKSGESLHDTLKKVFNKYR